jgi:hypothetical protein
MRQVRPSVARIRDKGKVARPGSVSGLRARAFGKCEKSRGQVRFVVFGRVHSGKCEKSRGGGVARGDAGKSTPRFKKATLGPALCQVYIMATLIQNNCQISYFGPYFSNRRNRRPSPARAGSAFGRAHLGNVKSRAGVRRARGCWEKWRRFKAKATLGPA